MRQGFEQFGFALVALFSLVVSEACVAQSPPPRAELVTQGWAFQPDPLRVGDGQHWERADFDRTGWRHVEVPMAWDFFDPVMDGYEGVGWYALQLSPDQINADVWQRLRFGRANYSATVWIDGHLAGSNLSGYLPFEIDASPWLQPGRPAWVVVRVENGARYDWLPGTTTVEWVQYGGLLEPVELLTTSHTYISHVALRATPGKSKALVSTSVEIRNTSADPFVGRIRLEIDGRSVDADARVPALASSFVVVEMELSSVKRWSPETPDLYTAHLQLLNAGRETDSAVERFGVRSIETKGRQILLNGSALRVRGVNRYDEFPGRGPVVDEAAIRADLRAVKAMGANLVRVHYPQNPMHLRIADEIGLLYMEEVPLNWWRAPFRPPTPPAFDNDRIIDVAEKTLEQMVRRDGNHPSLIIWSMANECQTADELGIRAMERLLRRAKALDPTRLVTYVANQAFEQNSAFKSADLVAVNLYYGMWDGPVANDLSEIEDRVYGPTRKGLSRLTHVFTYKPLLLSEFGTIGIPGSGGDMRFSEDYQAAYLAAVWHAVEAVPDVSGGIVWCWADYRHRRGFTNDFPTYFGPFGVMTFDRKPKKALSTLHTLWTETTRSQNEH